jgi:hypothetical protein
MFVAPLEWWRRVEITGQRTRKDWAEQTRGLLDEDFPDAERIILVMDNANLRFYNTHSIASLYETFPSDEAKRMTLTALKVWVLHPRIPMNRPATKQC